MTDTQPITDFSALGLRPELLQAVAGQGFTEMTPVQSATLPLLLAGRDVIAQAQTGSGKTAAFALGLLSVLDPSRIAVQALVLCPTRELADQVSKDIRRLASGIPNIKLLTLCGGIPLRPQLASLAHPPHVVVGTPGRIQELIEQDALDVRAVSVLVLDEADRMLDMGFEESVAFILKRTPAKRQTGLFSATWPDAIRALSSRFQRDPAEVTLTAAEDAPAIEQWCYEVEPARKLDAVLRLLGEHRPESAVVFCNTRKDTAEVADALYRRGVSALALHGDLEQRDRDEVLVRFANRSCSVLVATDVAARGLDIKDLPLVISFDVASDPDVHVHRIGRTGRAGQKGLALSLVAGNESRRVAAIDEHLGITLRWASLPAPRPDRALPQAQWQTLVIDGGRQDKVRPGDILGALTGTAGLPGTAVGKIDLFATRAYVAVRAELAGQALNTLRSGKIKGRNFRVRKLQ